MSTKGKFRRTCDDRYSESLLRELAHDIDAEFRREEAKLREAAGGSVKVLTKEEVRAMALRGIFESNERAKRERDR